MPIECVVNNHSTPERGTPPEPASNSPQRGIAPELAGTSHWLHALPWLVMIAVALGALAYLSSRFEMVVAAKHLSERGAYGQEMQR